MYVADIGQNIVEEISPVTAGANLGWNKWEGSFTLRQSRRSSSTNPRSDPRMTYPVVEYDHRDPLFTTQPAITGVVRLSPERRSSSSPNLMIFGDNPSGEIFYVNADKLPRRRTGRDPPHPASTTRARAKTLLQLISEKNAAQGKEPATRADLRFGVGPKGQMFMLNKRDGVIRLLVP